MKTAKTRKRSVIRSQSKPTEKKLRTNESERARRLRWRNANLENARASNRRYYEANREKVLASRKERNARP